MLKKWYNQDFKDLRTQTILDEDEDTGDTGSDNASDLARLADIKLSYKHKWQNNWQPQNIK